MNIRDVDALSVADKAADLQILADGQNAVIGHIGDGAVGAGIGASLQSLHVGGVLLGDDGSQILNKALENLVLGDEVSLGVDLQNHAHAIDNSGIGNALSGDLASLLDGSSLALFAQPLNGLVKIAVGLGQSLLAVHHAAVGHLAQLLNILSGKSHNSIPPVNCGMCWVIAESARGCRALSSKTISPRSSQRRPRQSPRPACPR